jgi:hypothetical protein
MRGLCLDHARLAQLGLHVLIMTGQLTCRLLPMQDHASVLLGRITQWRSAQLTPWKVPRKQQSSGGGANGSSPAKAATGRGSSKGGGGQQQALLGAEALARIYGSYSSCRTGGTVLALDKEGWLQMLRDGGVLTAGGRCVEGACVLSLRLSQLLTANVHCQCQGRGFGRCCSGCLHHGGWCLSAASSHQ